MGLTNLITKRLTFLPDKSNVYNNLTDIRTRDFNETAHESVDKSPEMSIPHLAQELDITTSTLRRIVTNDFVLHTYKVQLTDPPPPTGHAQRGGLIK